MSFGLAKQIFQFFHPLGRLAKWLAILQEYGFHFKIVKGGCSNLKNALIDLGENPKVNLLSAIFINDPWYGGIYNFLYTFSFPLGCTSYDVTQVTLLEPTSLYRIYLGRGPQEGREGNS